MEAQLLDNGLAAIVQGLVFRIWGPESRVQVLGFRVCDSGSRVEG